MNSDFEDCASGNILQRSSRFIVRKKEIKMDPSTNLKLEKLFESSSGIFCTLPSEPSLLLSYPFSEEQKAQLLEWYRLQERSIELRDSEVRLQIQLSFRNYSCMNPNNQGQGKHGIVYLRIDKLGTEQYEYISIELQFSEIKRLIEHLEYEEVQFFLENTQPI